MNVLAVRAVLREVGIVAVQAVHTLITKLAGLAKSAVDGVGQGPAVLAVVRVPAVAGIEAHITVLRDRNDVPVITVLAGSSPRPALGRLEVKLAEVLDEGLGIDWHTP